MSRFRSLLPVVSKAAPNSHSKAKYTAEQLKAKVAPAVIKACLDQTQTNGFTTHEIYEAVPEIKAAYKTPNALGTALGSGVKETGMGLHSKNGAFARCQENAVLATTCLSDEEFTALASDLGYDSPEALAAALAALPVF